MEGLEGGGGKGESTLEGRRKRFERRRVERREGIF